MARAVHYIIIIETHTTHHTHHTTHHTQQMQRVQRVPKDIDLITYRFIHRDIMKQLNSEYKRTIQACDCKDTSCIKVCDSCIHVLFLGERLGYNYRYIHTNRYNYAFIHDKRNNACGELPKNY